MLCPMGEAKKRHQAKCGKGCQDHNLGHGDDIAHRPSLRSAQIVDESKNNRHGHCQRHGQAFPLHPQDGHPTAIEEVSGVRAKTQGVEAASQRVGEPVHPPSEESQKGRKPLLDPHIPTPGLGEGGAQFGVGSCGEEGNEAIEEEGDQEGWARRARRMAGEDKDASPDHGPHADHGDVEGTQVTAESDLDFGFPGTHCCLLFNLPRLSCASAPCIKQRPPLRARTLNAEGRAVVAGVIITQRRLLCFFILFGSLVPSPNVSSGPM